MLRGSSCAQSSEGRVYSNGLYQNCLFHLTIPIDIMICLV